MVPNQFGPHVSGSPQPVPLDKQNILGTICPGGPNWLGTVCPEGPINRGPNVGDQMSGDHMRLGPNVSQPILGLKKYLTPKNIQLFVYMFRPQKRFC